MEKVETARVQIVLDTRRMLNSGNYPLKIRVTQGKKQDYYPAKVECSKDLFERAHSEKPRKDAKEFMNETILPLKRSAEQVVKQLPFYTKDCFKREFYKQSKREADVFSTYQDYIDSLHKQARISTAVSYRCSMKSLSAYIDGNLQEHRDSRLTGKKKEHTVTSYLAFEEITVEWLKEYETALRLVQTSSATIGIYMRSLRAIYNKGMESNSLLKELYPFGNKKYVIPTSEKIKAIINKSQIDDIKNYQTDDTTEQLARDMFVFSYLASGLNIADIIRLEKKDITYDNGTMIIQFVREKTKRASKKENKIHAKIAPNNIDVIKDIIARNGARNTSKYLFRFIAEKHTPIEQSKAKYSLLRRVNKALKNISKKLGIELNLTTYTARHTFANNMLRVNAPLIEIMKAMGHHNLKTTEIYLQSLPTADVVSYYEKL